MQIEISYEGKRGCGYRKPGKDGVGLYLFGPGIFEPCERLPFPLTVCPCCGAGIKFSRGFTWVHPLKLFAPDLPPKCTLDSPHNHSHCPLCNPEVAGEQAGLMWVGEKYYSPMSFTKEAMERGISKKVAGIPRGFEVGTHYIYLAHIKACIDFEFGEDLQESPGIFMVFKPQRVDIVVNSDDPDELPERARNLVESLGERARLLKVVPAEEMQAVLL